MTLAWLIVYASLFVQQGAASGDQAIELVRRLGSDRYAERQAAAKALEAMGQPALPALRAAAASKDAELRDRAAAIVDRIESHDLNTASSITLDFTDLALDEIVDRIGGRAPGRLAWAPATPASARQRRVTIREQQPLPFWAAIDRLCQSGGFHYIPGSPRGGGPAQFRLFLAPGSMLCPHAEHGPLRLEIVALAHSRQVNLIPGNREEFPRSRSMLSEFGLREEEFMATMRILAEPRMLIGQVGNALITLAVDDRGQSILPGPAPFLYHYGYGHGDLQACAAYILKLKRPERAGTVIKHFKLTIPVEVVALMPDGLEIPLEGSSGKTFRHGKESIEILAVERISQDARLVRFKVTSDETVPVSLDLDPSGKLAPVARQPAQPAVTHDAFQVLDRERRPFPFYIGNLRPDGPSVTAELMIHPDRDVPIPVPARNGVVPRPAREPAVPAVLLHTQLRRSIILATFEFTDIPLP